MNELIFDSLMLCEVYDTLPLLLSYICTRYSVFTSFLLVISWPRPRIGLSVGGTHIQTTPEDTHRCIVC